MKVAAGARFSVVLDSAGIIYTFGCNTVKECGKQGDRVEVPGKLDISSDEKAKGFEIFCGYSHTACITSIILGKYRTVDEAEVYTWGDASDGKLGHSVNELSAEPKLVETLAGSAVTAVGLGKQYSIFVTGSYGHSIKSKSSVVACDSANTTKSPV